MIDGSGGGAGATGVAGSAPCGSWPTSAGSFRKNRRTGTSRTSATPTSTIAPARQPKPTASVVRSGKNTSWPALTLAPNPPTTRPRLLMNQRFATVAPRTLATSPVASPDSSPNVSVSSQMSLTRTAMRSEAAVSARLRIVTPLIPITAISRPEIGPARP